MCNSKFQCEACGLELVEGDQQYSVEYIEEYLDGDAYTVTVSEDLINLCSGCHDKLCFTSKLDSMLTLEVNKRPITLPTLIPVYPGEYTHLCWRCGTVIQDGNMVCSVNHALEEIDDDELVLIETNISHVMCETCTKSIDYQSIARDAVRRVMKNARR